MALLLLFLLADNAEGRTFDSVPLLADEGVQTLTRHTSEALFGRSLFSQPYAATSIRHVDVYDRFPYLEARDFVVVSDPGWNRLLLGASGEGFVAFDGRETPFGPLSSPRGLVADDTDRLFVCDTGRNRILCFRSRVEFDSIDLLPLFAIDGVSRPFDVAWSDGGTPFAPEDDRLYVAESGRNRVARYALGPDGATFEAAIGSLGSGAGCFAGPTAIAVAPGEGGATRVVVADAHNQRLVELRDGPDGLLWVAEVPVRANPVTSLECDPFGNLFLASPGGNVVKLNPRLEAVAELPAAAPRVFHLPVATVIDHRSGIRTREGMPEALLVQAWGEGTGISRLRLGLELEETRVAEDGALSFRITDAARVTLERWDGSRWIEDQSLGVLSAGEHHGIRPRGSSADGPLRLSAQSLYPGGASALSLLDPSRPTGNWALLGASPNPSRGDTALRLWMPRRAAVELSLYDVAGRLVRHIIPDPAGPGLAEIHWDGRDESGHPAGSGFYAYRVRSEGATLGGRVLLLR